jgi:hypothetical protein
VHRQVQTSDTIFERFRQYDDASFGEKFFHLTNAEAESLVGPHGRTDNFKGENDGVASWVLWFSCCPVCQTPVKLTMPSLNVISSITHQGKVRFMMSTDIRNAKILTKLMKQLIKDTERKIFLILANLRVRHA